MNGKKLVLAEKPSVGRELARVLNCNKSANGYIEGKEYIVTWALGHLVTLADPEAYSDSYKNWSMEYLPMLPDRMKLTIIKQTSKQFNTVKDLLKRNDVDELIIATDAGREGELVARWIVEKAHFSKPMKRLWISSQTDKAIKDGFRNLLPAERYNNLYKAAQARSEADWIVGINVTRALTCKYNAQLSAGRVQTPTLSMIVNREEEIASFQPETFHTISVKAKGLKLQWTDGKNGNTRIFNKKKAEDLAARMRNGKVEVTEVKKNVKKKFSPALYDLTELQKDANALYGFSAKETLSLMQRLYENHKLLTYPRTDSRYLTQDLVATLPERLSSICHGQYAKHAQKLLNTKIKSDKRFADDSKVSDHHAIIPTEQKLRLSDLSDKEMKIYDLVAKRFLAVLFPAMEYELTSIKASCNSETLTAKGMVVLSKGWREIDERSDVEDSMESLPFSVSEGDVLPMSSVDLNEGKTTPPPRFNEGTLIKAMENPVKFMHTSDSQLIKTIGETGGLGTVATRADIIEKLFNSFYIEKKGKEIHPTSKGKQLVELAPSDLSSPVLTAQWEQKLMAISKGNLKKEAFINDMKKYTQQLISEVKSSSEAYKHDNLTRLKCPTCGKYMLEVNGKKGKMLVCQDRECGHREAVSRVTNARCPECHKKLELRGQGEGQIFVCPNCSYREKMSSFKKRKNNDNSKVSKREAQQYMKKINKENDEPLNSALAEALAKLKF